MNIEKLFQMEAKEFKNLKPEEKYKCALAMQIFTPYVGGKENPKAADCSGSVSLALMKAFGIEIRVTADHFYKKVFTEEKNGIDAMFLITNEKKYHFGRWVPAGTATHIVGLIEDDIVLDQVRPKARIRQIEYVAHYAKSRGYEIAIRGLNIEALKKHKGVAWGLDIEITAA